MKIAECLRFLTQFSGENRKKFESTIQKKVGAVCRTLQCTINTCFIIVNIYFYCLFTNFAHGSLTTMVKQ